MMPRRSATQLMACSAVCLGLTACGGGEVSGELSGLGSGLSVKLQNNGSDALTLRSNGPFAFNELLDAGDAYAVTVQTQPVGQLCSVTGGTGTIDADGASVDSVRVSCTFSASLRGTVSGLSEGTALTLVNGSATLDVTRNGAFAFAETLSDGTAYNVRVQTQPSGASCSIEGGSGVFSAASFNDITVSCG